MKQDMNGVRTPEDVVRRFDLDNIQILMDDVNGITTEVKKKVGEDEIISKINQSAEQVTINANKIKLEGYTTINNGFSVDEYGNMTANSGNIANFSITNNEGFVKKIYSLYDFTNDDITRITGIVSRLITPTDDDLRKYDLNKDGVIDLKDFVLVSGFYQYGITTRKPGAFKIKAPMNPTKLSEVSAGLYDANGNLVNGFDYAGGKFTALTVKRPNESNSVEISGGSIRLPQISINSSFMTLLDSSDNQTVTINGNTGQLEAKDIYYENLHPVSLEEKKKNIEDFNDALEIVKNSKIYTYNYNEEPETVKKHIGMVIGDNRGYREEVTTNNNKAIDLYRMCSVLWKAVQEQQEIIEDLKRKVEK